MRFLSVPMEEARVRFETRPLYKILAYDPNIDSISSIIQGNATQVPFDATEYCANISWSNSKLSFTLTDSDGLFHPDTGSARKNFMNKAIIRVLEGTDNIPELEWMYIFTGQIHGQIGWRISRQQKVLESKVTVYSRENSQLFQRRKITTNEYTIGTDIGIALVDIFTSFLGFSVEEIRLPTILGYQFMHLTNQLVDVTPWEGITAILQTVGMVPYFDGEGRLSAYNKNMGRPLARIYDNLTDIFEYEVPENIGDGINKVKVIFLNANLSKITSDDQILGTAQITTGFFTGSETLTCWWSDDHKQRAENTRMVTIKGINDNLIPWIGSENYSQLDEFHGEVNIIISIWVPVLAVTLMAVYIALALIPNWVVTVPFSFMPTINIGNIIQAIALVGILIIMMSLGSAQYEIWGTPYDYVYREEEAVAIEYGLAAWEENELVIKNDFMGSIDQARLIAITELIWEKCKNYTRRLQIRNDLLLEAGDIVAVPDGRKFVIFEISKTIQRGEMPLMTLDCYKVMTI